MLLVIFCDVTDVVVDDACWLWAVVDDSEEISKFEAMAEVANVMPEIIIWKGGGAPVSQILGWFVHSAT